MGIIYWGPYADLIDAYRHEGYAAREMPDGGLSGSWGGDVPDDAHVGFRAACDCGWTGPTLHPTGDFDSPGHQAAEAEWDADHLQPMIRKAAAGWPRWAESVSRRAVLVAGHVTAGRLALAVDLLDVLAEDIAARRRVVHALAEPDREERS